MVTVFEISADQCWLRKVRDHNHLFREKTLAQAMGGCLFEVLIANMADDFILGPILVGGGGF